jgi:hypothetical protein
MSDEGPAGREQQITRHKATEIVALTVRQSWANLIASGKKTIETRRWRTVHRGPLLICSSAQPRIAPAGCAVAIVNLIDCRPMTAADEALACCPVYPGAWAWVLAEIRPIKPFRVRGQQRLFHVTLPAAIAVSGVKTAPVRVEAGRGHDA